MSISEASILLPSEAVMWMNTDLLWSNRCETDSVQVKMERSTRVTLQEALALRSREGGKLSRVSLARHIGVTFWPAWYCTDQLALQYDRVVFVHHSNICDTQITRIALLTIL